METYGDAYDQEGRYIFNLFVLYYYASCYPCVGLLVRLLIEVHMKSNLHACSKQLEENLFEHTFLTFFILYRII